MILLDAVYINTSGGKILLEYLIDCLISKRIENKFFFLFDKRFYYNDHEKLNKLKYIYLLPSESKRKSFYIKESKNFNKIFCFANVPPPIKIINTPVFIFFHNTLLLNSNISTLNYTNKLFLAIKREYIKFKNNKSYKWIVQTQNISKVLEYKLSIKESNIEIIPIFNIEHFKKCNQQLKENCNNYLYVADSSSQKNHFILLDSWKLFSRTSKNANLVLHLTLPLNTPQKLLDKITLAQNAGCKIINHGSCSFDEIRQLYTTCNFLIYPSLAESFGLPLIEGAAAGCKIIAANLPYVFQVIQPSLTFNPYKKESVLLALLKSLDCQNIDSTILMVENKIDYLLNILCNA